MTSLTDSTSDRTQGK
ncbi:hypothetical protein F383_30592 [Gossypium arboreum]|uniref:Uncharacterized protein n=1 Tax=Gossypium arboreum TaxID=29729 RepID=A0A0B0MSY2_GOSAR|nr:hypothetical protein F383_30592 [Gossypium arboreum]